MSKAFTAPPMLATPRELAPPPTNDPMLVGIAVTIGLHALILGGAVTCSHFDSKATERKAQLSEEKYQTIEAGLAIKKKSAKGKKSRLPQKDLAPRVKPPDAPGVAMDANAQPGTKSKDDEYVPPDKQDPGSVFDRFRNVDTGDVASPDGDQGADDQNVGGSDEGHEFGTLDKAKGDPYVGELIGRMIKDFTVPSVVTETGLETWGCVKLEPDGKISEWKIDPDHKSGNHGFNSAVEDRLKQTTNMEAPVPDHLKALLVEQYACVKFKY